MNSIYEQLNKINDKESLSEKYNVKNAKELKKLRESTVSRKYSDQVWSVSFKSDPSNPIFTGDKEDCERFVKNNSSNEATKSRGGLVIKKGGTVPVITESSHGEQDVRHEAQRIYQELISKGYTLDEMESIFSVIRALPAKDTPSDRSKLKKAFPDLDI